MSINIKFEYNHESYIQTILNDTFERYVKKEKINNSLIKLSTIKSEFTMSEDTYIKIKKLINDNKEIEEVIKKDIELDFKQYCCLYK